MQRKLPATTPPAPQFVAIHSKESPGMANVMRAGVCVAVATSYTMGRRIAHALNWYKPGSRGH